VKNGNADRSGMTARGEPYLHAMDSDLTREVVSLIETRTRPSLTAQPTLNRRNVQPEVPSVGDILWTMLESGGFFRKAIVFMVIARIPAAA